MWPTTDDRHQRRLLRVQVQQLFNASSYADATQLCSRILADNPQHVEAKLLMAVNGGKKKKKKKKKRERKDEEELVTEQMGTA